MKQETILGELYLFKLRTDCSVERVVLNIIGKNSSYYLTRNKETNYKNSYAIADLGVYKSHRVLLEEDDESKAKEIMRKALFLKLLDAQDKANRALDTFSRFKEVNQ